MEPVLARLKVENDVDFSNIAKTSASFNTMSKCLKCVLNLYVRNAKPNQRKGFVLIFADTYVVQTLIALRKYG